jgi:hypothetical protein
MTAVCILAVTYSAFQAACAPNLRPSDTSDAGSSITMTMDGSIPGVSGQFRHTVSDGVVTTVVDATSHTSWAYLDLDTGLAIETDNPTSSTEWDIAFKRFYVITNGGISGTAGVAAARVTPMAFADLSEAPATGWILDGEDTDLDDDTGTDSAFNGGPESQYDWYQYTPGTHNLSPKSDLVFVVKTGEGNFFKLTFLAYYDPAGTPGYVQFTWAPIASTEIDLPDGGVSMRPDGGVGPDAGMMEPIPDDALTVDGSARDTFTYVRVGEGVVSIADPSTSTDWDLAFGRAIVRTNSGTSGPGGGGAASAGAVAYDSVVSVGDADFAIDELSDESSTNPVLGSWFSYDVSTHSVTPKRDIWLVRTATGGYAKLRIWSWSDGVFQISLDALPVAATE